MTALLHPGQSTAKAQGAFAALTGRLVVRNINNRLTAPSQDITRWCTHAQLASTVVIEPLLLVDFMSLLSISGIEQSCRGTNVDHAESNYAFPPFVPQDHRGSNHGSRAAERGAKTFASCRDQGGYDERHTSCFPVRLIDSHSRVDSADTFRHRLD
jgi:hypothetical protein